MTTIAFAFVSSARRRCLRRPRLSRVRRDANSTDTATMTLSMSMSKRRRRRRRPGHRHRARRHRARDRTVVASRRASPSATTSRVGAAMRGDARRCAAWHSCANQPSHRDMMVRAIAPRVVARATACTARCASTTSASTSGANAAIDVEGDDDGTTERGQERALVHYCKGLREALRACDDDGATIARERESLVRACERLKATLPVKYRSGAFMSAGALATAFGYELERARSAEHLAAITNVKVRAAEKGLVPYHSARESYARVRELLDGSVELRHLDFAANRIEDAKSATPWTLTHNTPAFDAKLVAAAIEVRRTGYAIVDGLVGEPMASAIRHSLENFVDEDEDARTFSKGELDQSERRILGDATVDNIRDDTIAWLKGDERDMVGAFAQFLRVTLLHPLFNAFATTSRGSPSAPPLAPVDSYVSNAMLSVYAPGARGFVSHVDNCGPDIDPRALSVVYYPISSTPEEGGAMVLFPGHKTKEVRLTPTRDRLVLFASARVPHAVEPRARDASRRIAASFWFVGQPLAVMAAAET